MDTRLHGEELIWNPAEETADTNMEWLPSKPLRLLSQTFAFADRGIRPETAGDCLAVPSVLCVAALGL